MVSVSASVNLPLHHKVQKFLFWHRLTRVVPEKGRKTVVVVVVCYMGWYRDGTRALVAISKGMWVVKVCSSKILQLSTWVVS